MTRTSYESLSSAEQLPDRAPNCTFAAMEKNRLGRTLALGVMAVTVFSTLAAVSLPIRDRRPSVATTVLLAIVLVTHASCYWWGDRIRARAGMAAYVAIQASAIFIVGLAGAVFSAGMGGYIALSARPGTL